MCKACIIWAEMAAIKMTNAARYIEEAQELERMIQEECADKQRK